MTGVPYSLILLNQLTAQFTSETGEKVHFANAGGSKPGLELLEEGQLDLAGSDLLTARYRAIRGTAGNWRVLPIAAWAVAIVYHINGLDGNLVLDGPTLAKIWLGKITRWSDPELRNLNPTLRLPEKPIVVVSGFTSDVDLVLTTYLSHHSDEWKRNVGSGLHVNWPVGTKVKGGATVQGEVRQVDGSIGGAK